MIRDDAIEIWKAGVAAVHGRTLTEKALRLDSSTLFVNDHSFDLENFDRIMIVGGGKFSHFMAEGFENVLGPELAQQKQLSGLVTVPDGSLDQVKLNFIEAAECRPAGVNLPTDRVLSATGRMLSLLTQTNERTLVIALISGGGSALLESSSLPLRDIIATTNWLSSRGANILQLNTVRIAISDVKGGGLARAMPAGTMVGLIVSDVPNDDLRFVSSGPPVDFGDDVVSQALNVLEQFGATSDSSFPQSALKGLEETRTVLPFQASVTNFLVGDANVARDAAISKAKSLGYAILFDTLADTETCNQIADVVCNYCCDTKRSRQCIVSLGEPIVQPGDSAGQGGRNQHAVLSAIQKLLDENPEGQFCFLSAGTDGEDGNTLAAGASVTHKDLQRLGGQKEEITSSLARFDSHPILAVNGLTFDSDPTATNVADLRILLRGWRPVGTDSNTES